MSSTQISLDPSETRQLTVTNLPQRVKFAVFQVHHSNRFVRMSLKEPLENGDKPLPHSTFVSGRDIGLVAYLNSSIETNATVWVTNICLERITTLCSVVLYSGSGKHISYNNYGWMRGLCVKKVEIWDSFWLSREKQQQKCGMMVMRDECWKESCRHTLRISFFRYKQTLSLVHTLIHTMHSFQMKNQKTLMWEWHKQHLSESRVESQGSMTGLLLTRNGKSVTNDDFLNFSLSMVQKFNSRHNNNQIPYLEDVTWSLTWKLLHSFD